MRSCTYHNGKNYCIGTIKSSQADFIADFNGCVILGSITVEAVDIKLKTHANNNQVAIYIYRRTWMISSSASWEKEVKIVAFT
jgi:hypothetical protein